MILREEYHSRVLSLHDRDLTSALSRLTVGVSVPGGTISENDTRELYRVEAPLKKRTFFSPQGREKCAGCVVLNYTHFRSQSQHMNKI